MDTGKIRKRDGKLYENSGNLGCVKLRYGLPSSTNTFGVFQADIPIIEAMRT